jgi:hypothetical protein
VVKAGDAADAVVRRADVQVEAPGDPAASKDRVAKAGTAGVEAAADTAAIIARVSSRKVKACSRDRWTTAIAMAARASAKAVAAAFRVDISPPIWNR